VKKLFQVTIAVLCIFALAMWLRNRFEAADNRQTSAQSWSSNDAHFVAVGTGNNTLYVALPDGDAVSCDACIYCFGRYGQGRGTQAARAWLRPNPMRRPQGEAVMSKI